MTTPAERAKAFRETHLLNVAFAATSGKLGDLKEACDLAEAAILSAIREAYEDAAGIAEQIATNAERRWAQYGDYEIEAKRAALSKLEAAHQCALAIRAKDDPT